jgi:hypothetical protein
MEAHLRAPLSARAGLRVRRLQIGKALGKNVSETSGGDAGLLTVCQDERVQHSKRQSVRVLEKSSESCCCGQPTAEREARVGEWILLIKDRFITGQVAPDFSAHDSSRYSPEEQKGAVQKCNPRRNAV